MRKIISFSMVILLLSFASSVDAQQSTDVKVVNNPNDPVPVRIRNPGNKPSEVEVVNAAGNPVKVEVTNPVAPASDVTVTNGASNPASVNITNDALAVEVQNSVAISSMPPINVSASAEPMPPFATKGQNFGEDGKVLEVRGNWLKLDVPGIAVDIAGSRGRLRATVWMYLPTGKCYGENGGKVVSEYCS